MKGVIVALVFILGCSAQAATLHYSPIRDILLVHEYVEKVAGELIQDNSRVSSLVNINGESRTLRANTWQIPNRIGTGFSLVVGFIDIPLRLDEFMLEVSYPEMTLPSGETRSEIVRPIDIRGHDGTYLWGFEFFFDFPYETIPGEWDFKIFAQGHLIHRSSFTIVEELSIVQ